MSFDIFLQGFANGKAAPGRADAAVQVLAPVAAGWVIMPVGCPVCVVADGQAADLPDELRDDVVVVHCGAELLQVIRSD